MSQPDFSPAADRNKQPILDVLRQVLPERGSALEIASGTGQHLAWFASGLPHWTWQPTDAQPGALATIAARVAQQGLTNVRAPSAALGLMRPVKTAGVSRSGLISSRSSALPTNAEPKPNRSVGSKNSGVDLNTALPYNF